MTDAPESTAAPDPAPLATGPRGMRLLSFHPAAEHDESAHFPDAPVGYALVVLRHGARVLMVRVRARECWELPGGGIEPDESPRQAAARELREEAGQRLPESALRFVGFARTGLSRGDAHTPASPLDAADPSTGAESVLYGAVFSARTETPQDFVPNAEISAAHWRTGTEPLPDGDRVQTVDEYLVALCGESR